ncbi:uncharacterized protein HD556DRAFT_1539245 [Suillus plorans]|uniref:Transmembrane protein n=1 Tax=Suillus plorans TaxID=116603 RepID=A0A9P7ADI9_9AGAM|nr:uncharacterized protein HD556DRAFT_1539245 [Suillus plorans]KAG1787123.1 hypothetical protein HD556DRAFT_1539245 [Suillus plorans]
MHFRFANFVQIHLSPTTLLLFTVFGQIVIMGFAWGFTGAIWYMEVLVLPDHIVYLIVEYPTVLTLIVTLISTALAIITSTFFTFSVKEALRHHLSGSSITLFKLRTAIALSRPTWILRWRFLKLSALTLVVYAMVTFLSTSWSTFLLPTLVRWPVETFGTELDLESGAFVNQLSTDLKISEANSLQAPTFDAISVLTLLSGIAAVGVQGGVETSSMFSFNGVSYNQSTGTQGITKNYTVTQQGLTANVTCQPIDRSQNTFSVTPYAVPGPTGSDMTFITWETEANCSGTPDLNSVTSFTVGLANGLPDDATEGLLPTVVCPNPNSTAFNPYKFDIFMSGLYKYSFLPTIVCEVVPYLTTVNVTYNGGIISVDRISASSGSTSSSNLPVSQFIADVMSYQAGIDQATSTNTIGNFLTAYGLSNVSVMYNELVNFPPSSGKLLARYYGVLLYSTSIRILCLGSSVEYDKVDQRHYVYHDVRLAKPILHVYLSVGGAHHDMGCHHIGRQLQPHARKTTASDPSFDFSDPVDLIIAASGGRLETQLCDNDEDQEGHREDIIVRFEDVTGEMGKRIPKRLVTVVPATP